MNSLELFLTNILPHLKNFDDFYQLINQGFYSNEQKDYFFQQIIKYLFELHPFYKNIIRHVWLFDEIPLDILSILKFPNKDRGIDLVIKTKNDTYIAVQCKFRINKFLKAQWKDLSEIIGFIFEKVFYVTNTYSINNIIDSQDRVVNMYGDFFENLDSFFFNNVRNMIHNKDIIYKPIGDEYQNIFSFDAFGHFIRFDKGFVSYASQFGKILPIYWFDRDWNNQTTIIGLQSIDLFYQFYKEWLFESLADNKKINFLLIGPITSIKNYDKNNGLILTTNEQEIESFFKNKHKKKKVIIFTYFSAEKFLNILKKLNLEIDLGIFDEVHKIDDEKNPALLFFDNETIKINNRLFITINTKFYKNLGKIDEYVSIMNNEEIFGKEFSKFSLRDSIIQKTSCEYQILTLFTNEKYIINSLGWDQFEQIDNKIYDINHIAIALMLLKSMQNNNCSHMVTYHNSIENSKNFRCLLEILIEKKNLDIRVFQIDGNSNPNYASRVSNSFNINDKCIMTSIKVLNENKLIKMIDSICFVDQMESSIDVIQCIEGALKPNNKKTNLKIVMPFLVDDLKTLDSNLHNNKLINLIKVLVDTDEILHEFFLTKTKENKYSSGIFKFDGFFDKDDKILIGKKINIDLWTKKIIINCWEKINLHLLGDNKLENIDILKKQLFNDFVGLNNDQFDSSNESDNEKICDSYKFINESSSDEFEMPNSEFDFDFINQHENPEPIKKIKKIKNIKTIIIRVKPKSKKIFPKSDIEEKIENFINDGLD